MEKRKKVLVIGFECEKCHKPDGIRQKKDKIFGICKECAKKEILENFCNKYLEYIKECLLHDYDNNMLLSKFNDILKSEVVINRKSITIENSIVQLSKYKNVITKKIKMGSQMQKMQILKYLSIYTKIFLMK